MLVVKVSTTVPPNTIRGNPEPKLQVWQSRPDLVADLLETGVQVDAQDQESSWYVCLLQLCYTT